jgi:hypothetical protein
MHVQLQEKIYRHDRIYKKIQEKSSSKVCERLSGTDNIKKNNLLSSVSPLKIILQLINREGKDGFLYFDFPNATLSHDMINLLSGGFNDWSENISVPWLLLS